MLFNRIKLTHQHNKDDLALVILALVLTGISISLINTLLLWIILLVVCALVIRAAICFNLQRHLPSIRTLNLLAVLSILGLVYSGLQSGLLFSMLNLLVLACALKLMQIRQRKDLYQLILSVFFLLSCGFIFHQTIGFSVFYLFLTFSLLLSLVCMHAPSIHLKQQYKTVFRLSAQALPIALILFLVLPQLSPFWHLPTVKGAETGLAERITPGDIAQLTQSTDLVFRATFYAPVPAPSQRYWRALVMEEFDGKTWQVHHYRKQSRALLIKSRQQFQANLLGQTLNYDLIVEPNNQQWLFALAISVASDNLSAQSLIFNPDFTLFTKRPIVSQSFYSLNAYPQALALQPLSDIDRQLNLSLPESGNPRTQKWIAQLKANSASEQGLIQSIKDYFQQQDFVYSLRPPMMPIDPIDQFLFDQQSGFCSHYASALAYSLRLAGIPARIVTGYLGGELVSQANNDPYISVYQYDAHAWVEAWTEATGWQRIDPTAWVAPDRIEFGLRQAMQQEDSFLADSPFSLANLTQISWLNDIRLFIADLDYNWSRWVLGFNSQKQRELFKSILGQLSHERLTLFACLIVVLIGVLLGLFFMPHWLKNRKTLTQRLYHNAVQQFSAHPRQPWQGAESYSQFIVKHYPAPVSQAFVQLTQLYIQLQYQGSQSATRNPSHIKPLHKKMRYQLKQLKKAIKKLDPSNKE